VTDKKIIARIVALYAAGMLPKEIAPLVRVPVSTVRGIVKRGIVSRVREKNLGKKIARRKSRPIFSFTPEPYRCPGCGHLVSFRPCLICRDRFSAALEHANAAATPHEGPREF
jgi:hypothetical protein